MKRSLVTVNTLLLAVGIFSCFDIPIYCILVLFTDDPYTLIRSSSDWFTYYLLVYWISRFVVTGLLPLLFADPEKRASIKWSLLIVVILFIWENAMDFLRHGYLCYCDYRPLKTYALLLMTFAVIYAVTHGVLRRKTRR